MPPYLFMVPPFVVLIGALFFIIGAMDVDSDTPVGRSADELTLSLAKILSDIETAKLILPFH